MESQSRVDKINIKSFTYRQEKILPTPSLALNPGTLIEMFATVEPNFSTLSESKVAAEIRAIASTQAPIVKNAADGEHSFRYVLTPGEDPVSLFWYSCTTVLVP